VRRSDRNCVEGSEFGDCGNHVAGFSWPCAIELRMAAAMSSYGSRRTVAGTGRGMSPAMIAAARRPASSTQAA